MRFCQLNVHCFASQSVYLNTRSSISHLTVTTVRMLGLAKNFSNVFVFLCFFVIQGLSRHENLSSDVLREDLYLLLLATVINKKVNLIMLNSVPMRLHKCSSEVVFVFVEILTINLIKCS